MFYLLLDGSSFFRMLWSFVHSIHKRPCCALGIVLQFCCPLLYQSWCVLVAPMSKVSMKNWRQVRVLSQYCG